VQVVIENIYQPHNASAIIRSCECFGVQDVHVIEKEYTFNTNPDIVMGAEKWMTIHRSTDTHTCLKQLKEKGYLIAATTLRADAVPMDHLGVEKPLALVFGTEEAGLSEEAHDMADVFVKLPMFGFTQSFNVSVSAALSLTHIMGRLRSSQVPWRLSASEAKTLKLEWLMKSTPHGEALVRRWQEEKDKIQNSEFKTNRENSKN
jgi:tRNA (guanosine-2'-O-)-methyltransferase